MSLPCPAMASPLGGASLPAQAGIGLRHPHVAEVIERAPAIGWLEIHSENYLVPGGPRMAALETIGEHYPLSFHGVGLSLGSADGLDGRHLDRLKELIDRFAPSSSPSICRGP